MTSIYRSAQPICIVVLVVLALVSSCDRNGGPLYRAEKQIFEANKMNRELSRNLTTPEGEFLDRTVAAYRAIVDEFSGASNGSKELESIVVTAQMSLAELEFHVGRIPAAREDFVAVLSMVENVPVARMNALYSAGVLSELVADIAKAAEYYEQFFDEYLTLEQAASTAAEQVRYIVTPLKLSRLQGAMGNSYGETLWLQKAETLYSGLIADAKNETVIRDVRFNLLTVLIQQEKWDDALALSEEIARLYPDPENAASILFLQARIQQRGLDHADEALKIYQEIYESLSRTASAPKAMLAAADILLATNEFERAEGIYLSVVRDYPGEASSAAEAEWRLAEIEERRGDWIAASLRFKSIEAKYPVTRYGLEAPLQLALGYQKLDEKKTADGWFAKALGSYSKIIEGQYGVKTRISAEEYVLQVLTLQERWADAVEHLLALPDRYPGYVGLRHNYVVAANIYEVELEDVGRAIDVLEQCKARYPNTRVAVAADEQLKRLRAIK